MAHLLVVDDEAGLRELVAEILLADGHVVATARDGVEALAELGRRGFDLLLTDLKMPRLDGMELVRRCRAEWPEMEVVVLTAYGTVETAVEAMSLGAFTYLQKPISSPAALRLVARRALERRQLLSGRDERRRLDEAMPEMVAVDPVMTPILAALAKVAPTEAAVLLLGDSGSGKEVAARAIHRQSGRADGPFVAVNCAAIAAQLVESELFGHERGAFTGATAQRRGRLELAAGGTFFLDEVGELPLELQAKLLRVLQERRFERLGGSRTLVADVRIIAATNRDLDLMRRQGGFREDLYHRLAVFPIRLPNLAERRQDIVPLAEVLLRRIAANLGRPGLHLAAAASAGLAARDWPGNVRELSNALERAAILADGDELLPRHFAVPGLALAVGSERMGGSTTPPESAPSLAGRAAGGLAGWGQPAGGGGTLAEIERAALVAALAAQAGHRQRAADQLGVSVRALYDMLRRHGLR